MNSDSVSFYILAALSAVTVAHGLYGIATWLALTAVYSAIHSKRD